MNRKSALPINALCVKTIIIATVKTNKIGQNTQTNKQPVTQERKKEVKQKTLKLGENSYFLFQLPVKWALKLVLLFPNVELNFIKTIISGFTNRAQ